VRKRRARRERTERDIGNTSAALLKSDPQIVLGLVVGKAREREREREEEREDTVERESAHMRARARTRARERVRVRDTVSA